MDIKNGRLGNINAVFLEEGCYCKNHEGNTYCSKDCPNVWTLRYFDICVNPQVKELWPGFESPVLLEQKFGTRVNVIHSTDGSSSNLAQCTV